MVERKDKKYSIESVFKFIKDNFDRNEPKKRYDFDGDMMKPQSVRYDTFMSKGVVCVACGCKAQYFYKERNQARRKKNHNPNEPYHFNMYGIDSNGDEVLFTKDHIIPSARGGSDGVGNMVTMCQTCNTEKGKTLPAQWQDEHPNAQQLPKGNEKPKYAKIMTEHRQKLVDGFEIGVMGVTSYMTDYLTHLSNTDDGNDYSEFIESVQYMITNSEHAMSVIANKLKNGEHNEHSSE